VLDAAEDLDVTFAPLGAAEIRSSTCCLLPPIFPIRRPHLGGTFMIPRLPDDAPRQSLRRMTSALWSSCRMRRAGLETSRQDAMRGCLRPVAEGAAAANNLLVALSNVSDQPPPLLQQTADRLLCLSARHPCRSARSPTMSVVKGAIVVIDALQADDKSGWTCCRKGGSLRSMKHAKSPNGYGIMATERFVTAEGRVAAAMKPSSFACFMLRSEPPLRQRSNRNCHRPGGRR